MPKNSGLEDYRNALQAMPNEKILVRAEDVSFFVDKLISKGINAVGITGLDLQKEYKFKNPLSEVRVIQNLGWGDESALFGKPTLCLLGPIGGKGLLPQMLGVVAINKKYSAIADNYLGKLRQKGISFEKILLNGATELAAEVGIANYVIDIVVSGKSAKEAGLRVYERILESEAVLVGGYDEK